MKILVTGGTGVIGEGVIPELIARGHNVRLLSRHANDDAQQWSGVEPFEGNVADKVSLIGASRDCDAILHIAGIVQEHPPDITFQSVNVDGTANILEEAKRSQVRRFVFVSSLGADIGESDYHKSKLEAERLVQGSGLDWTIIRPGNVYGPGDEVITTILKMVRMLPAVPVIDSGEQQFQPMWHEDLARVLATAVERADVNGAILEAAGPDITTMNDLLRRFAEITGRSPVRVPVPARLAELAARISPFDVPLDDTKLSMLKEKNVIRGESATARLGVTATPLDRGLRLLADALQETLPEEGFGALEHKRFYADIIGSRYNAVSLMSLFKDRINDVMPIEFVAEPGAPDKVEKGATMTGSLPLRGNIQVRVEVSDPTHVVFATIEGHPLAGIVEFTTGETATGVSFSVDTYTRASNFFDWLAVRTVGAPAQNANWRGVVRRVIDFSGGTSDGVHEEKQKLSEEDAEQIEKRVRGLVQARKRDETEERAQT